MRIGRRLAIDAGKVRIGVAISDAHAILASPLATVQRLTDLERSTDEILQLVANEDILECYVGLPLSLAANSTASTADAVALAKSLAAKASFEIRFVDERLTTVAASSSLQASGMNSKQQRGVIDQVAATLILEQAIAIEKSTDEPPGLAIDDYEE